MPFYVKLNANDIVTGISETHSKIVADNMIAVESLDISLISKKYNRETFEFENKQEIIRTVIVDGKEMDVTYIVEGDYPDGEYKKRVKKNNWTLNGIDYIITGDWPDGRYVQQVREKGHPKILAEIAAEKKQAKKDKLFNAVKTVDMSALKSTDIGKCLVAIMCNLLDIDELELTQGIANISKF